ncbi:Conserved_hypothetical protein [Hexamita inflata]|uniref:Myb-like domain-containing protein n=1 Tax=Hexamita inflata TaxID=28002 RepID=A0ABP1GWC3_9EUKA
MCEQYVRSQVSCQTWSEIDLEILQNAVQKHGKDWPLIAQKYFPNRKPNCLKCKYNYFLRRMQTTSIKLASFNGFDSYQQQIQNQSLVLQKAVSTVSTVSTSKPITPLESNSIYDKNSSTTNNVEHIGRAVIVEEDCAFMNGWEEIDTQFWEFE